MRRRFRLTIVNPVTVSAAVWCGTLLIGLLTLPPDARVDEDPLMFVRGLFCLFGSAASVTLILPWLWLRARPDGVAGSAGRLLRTRWITGFGVVARRIGPLRLFVVTCEYGDETVPLRATASRDWWRAAEQRRRLEHWLAAAREPLVDASV